eukprot:6320454-Amphidinium_carterae.1
MNIANTVTDKSDPYMGVVDVDENLSALTGMFMQPTKQNQHKWQQLVNTSNQMQIAAMRVKAAAQCGP